MPSIAGHRRCLWLVRRAWRGITVVHSSSSEEVLPGPASSSEDLGGDDQEAPTSSPLAPTPSPAWGTPPPQVRTLSPPRAEEEDLPGPSSQLEDVMEVRSSSSSEHNMA
ncbi:uncharacterized protein ACMZJ9_013551 [Mantella aurantiaca]